MAVLYSMRALAQIDNSFVFWTSETPDLEGAGAPEVIVADSAVIVGTSGFNATLAVLGYHDTTHSPAGLWQFNNDLTDSSGNGFDLSVDTGTISYAEISPQVSGIFFNGSARLERLSNDAALTITGPVTIEVLIIPFDLSLCGILGFSSSLIGSGTEYNVAYQTQISSGEPVFFSTDGAGATNHFANTGETITNNLQHYVMVRESNNSVSFYMNGVFKFNGDSCPTEDASSSRLFVGSNGPFTGFFTGMMASLKIVDGALSANDVKAEYNRTLGPLLGTV